MHNMVKKPCLYLTEVLLQSSALSVFNSDSSLHFRNLAVPQTTFFSVWSSRKEIGAAADGFEKKAGLGFGKVKTEC